MHRSIRSRGVRTLSLEDAQNAVTGDNLDLGNAVGVTEDDTNLRRGGTLPGELANLLDDLLRSGLEPGGGSARVGERRGGDTLSLGVKTTHLGGCGGGGRW